MKVAATVPELRAACADLARPLGLVPTMGSLHEGHLSLVRRARRECARVAVSIFVNPAQFGPNEDLDAYPRDLERDLRLLQADQVDVVWTPAARDVYPAGFETWVTVEKVSQPLEGRHRPGHFRGVATIVAKLFNAFQPDRAYFGQKDAQQTLVIRRMVEDLDFPLEVVVCPIVRESDGLAMSSRNRYLSTEERTAATVLYRALQSAARAFAHGERGANALRAKMHETLGAEPLARTQYASVADPETLEELAGSVDCALLSLAVWIGRTRLIDNVLVGDKGGLPGRMRPHS